ncbi:polyribonucleotide nucleotidyltransferase [Striga asiatica]|uniref:Polyribonucleotide nucleotidyltransferase n=1 Tax=Striga asiatica TaxID=4170 RepID=A0A5A7NZY5_STRAF|nr:polyribonucleotide nucleotidyltransferase [Striga asiatica]
MSHLSLMHVSSILRFLKEEENSVLHIFESSGVLINRPIRLFEVGVKPPEPPSTAAASCCGSSSAAASLAVPSRNQPASSAQGLLECFLRGRGGFGISVCFWARLGEAEGDEQWRSDVDGELAAVDVKEGEIGFKHPVSI